MGENSIFSVYAAKGLEQFNFPDPAVWHEARRSITQALEQHEQDVLRSTPADRVVLIRQRSDTLTDLRMMQKELLRIKNLPAAERRVAKLERLQQLAAAQKHFAAEEERRKQQQQQQQLAIERQAQAQHGVAPLVQSRHAVRSDEDDFDAFFGPAPTASPSSGPAVDQGQHSGTSPATRHSYSPVGAGVGSNGSCSATGGRGGSAASSPATPGTPHQAKAPVHGGSPASAASFQPPLSVSNDSARGGASDMTDKDDPVPHGGDQKRSDTPRTGDDDEQATDESEDDDLLQQVQEDVDAMLVRNVNVEWSDVIGLPSAVRLLKEAVQVPVMFPELFQEKRKPWRGILLYGYVVMFMFVSPWRVGCAFGAEVGLPCVRGAIPSSHPFFFFFFFFFHFMSRSV